MPHGPHAPNMQSTPASFRGRRGDVAGMVVVRGAAALPAPAAPLATTVEGINAMVRQVMGNLCADVNEART